MKSAIDSPMYSTPAIAPKNVMKWSRSDAAADIPPLNTVVAARCNREDVDHELGCSGEVLASPFCQEKSRTKEVKKEKN
jgi:hypothetical protein